MELIELNVPVQRDKEGCWTNPGVPNFDEDHEAYKAWLEAQGLETTYAALESEDIDHPAYVRYFDDGEADISDWTPVLPAAGEGWHTLSIHMGEDTPYWVWARRVAS
ncbi:hypothetical protein [Massilia endophytica]|uniref:hypothetical protein n=1 Tax=Massilia endophytica TaxID=2899220 RepID=UPI001E5013CF|nr:hypothetical protein [Massilia endophytica]UGQ44936.1 hypothetical protein LSQ66_14130 [Massilia endophytica]